MTNQTDPKDQKIAELEQRLKSIEEKADSDKQDTANQTNQSLNLIVMAIGFLFLLWSCYTLSNAFGLF